MTTASVSIRARVHVWGWFFKLPILRRFEGFTLTPWDIVLKPEAQHDKALLRHELHHIYMWRRHWLFPLSYLLYGYKENPFELLARLAENVPSGD